MPFSFGHPWFLLGGLSIAVPIYLHLYYRKKPVPKDFPSLRLIRLSVEAIIRRMKLRNLLILALRILILTLLTLAFAKPFLGSLFGTTAPSGAPAAFVVILDNSLSMGASHQGISLFNSAKAKALEVLDKMGPYDKAAVILLNDPGTMLFSQLTWDKSELKEAVRNVPLSAAGTNIFGALNPALKLLAPVKNFKRSIYLITDMTNSSWKPFLTTYDLSAIDKSLDLVLIPIGEGIPPNVAVTELGIESPLVLKDRPTPMWATIANYSIRPQKTRLSVFIEDDKKHDISIDLQPNDKKRVTFSCEFKSEGVAHVRAALPTDSLSQDDTRHLAVKVMAPQKVLIIKPPPDREGNITKEDLFLRFALNPLNRSQGATFNVESRYVDETVSLELTRYSAIFLVNQRDLPEPFVNNLTSFVLGGGNLIIFCGSRVDPEWYNANLIDKLGGKYLLPARVFKRVGNAVSKSVAYQLTDLDTGHPAFKIFGTDGNGDPGKAQVYEFFQVKPDSSALVLARLSHGLPGILEEKRGQGRVLFVAFTADTAWTNWPLKPTFLPFIHQSIIGMLKKQGLNSDSILPGTPVSILLQEEGLKKVELTPPHGPAQELPIRKEGEGLIHFSTVLTDQPGFYKLSIERSSGIQTEAFTVNPPPEESDLDRMEIRKVPRFIAIKHTPGGTQTLGDKVALVREGSEMGISLLWILLIAAFLETLVANLSTEVGKKGFS